MEVFINIIVGLLGLGIVVFVHEAGHFLAAKSFGITVQAFSIGWGKKIFSFKKGETEYRISLLPLGGYCQLKGDEVLREAIEQNKDRIEAEEGTIFSVAPWKRIVVFFSGPLMNLIFAIVILSIIWFNGFTYFSPDSRIILASDYNNQGEVFPADIAGLRSGDRVIEIDNRTIRNYQHIREIVAHNAERRMDIVVAREERIIGLEIEPRRDRRTGAGVIGVLPWIDPVIAKVEPGSPADLAGLMQGDLITEVSGIPVNNQMDFLGVLEPRPESVNIRFIRNRATHSTSLTLIYNEEGQTNLGFGFSVDQYETPRYSLFGAAVKGVQESFSIVFVSIKGLRTIFRGDVDINQAVSGPIRITYMVGELATTAFGESIRTGLISFFRFLCLISVVLFFMNLLPIPALDGGHIIFALCETIFRRNFKPKVIYRYQIVGFVFIIMLLFFTLFNDILFFISR
ncbi:MAG: RIP metalloprotease RseP [Spirochaetaceae bacterium]|nr:RIP metalloprotease RseP [Spirochaetaceae bacterium]